VIQSRRKKNLPVVQPLTGLIPFVANTALLVSWLAHPSIDIVHSAKLLPFIGYWGMA
jgi:ethanolaminephosphotransferase